MPRYRVYLTKPIHCSVDVDADDPDSAVDEALLNAPGSVMFLDHTYPDEGEWDVSDEDLSESVEVLS